MIVVMKSGATEGQVLNVGKVVRELGFKDHRIGGAERTVVAVLGHVYPELIDELGVIDGVDSVVRISKPFKLASRRRTRRTRCSPNRQPVDRRRKRRPDGRALLSGRRGERGGGGTRGQSGGGAYHRGGAYKPRTSPYAFRGHGEEALHVLAAARRNGAAHRHGGDGPARRRYSG